MGKVLYKYKPFHELSEEPNCTIIDEVERIADKAFDSIYRPMRIIMPKNLKELDITAILPSDYDPNACTFVLPEEVGEDYPYPIVISTYPVFYGSLRVHNGFIVEVLRRDNGGGSRRQSIPDIR